MHKIERLFWILYVTAQYVGLKGRFVPVDTPGPNLYVVQVTAKVPFTLEVTILVCVLDATSLYKVLLCTLYLNFRMCWVAPHTLIQCHKVPCGMMSDNVQGKILILRNVQCSDTYKSCNYCLLLLSLDCGVYIAHRVCIF